MTFAAEPITSRGVPDLSFLLTHASHVLATRMTAAFAEIGITPREYGIIDLPAATAPRQRSGRSACRAGAERPLAQPVIGHVDLIRTADAAEVAASVARGVEEGDGAAVPVAGPQPAAATAVDHVRHARGGQRTDPRGEARLDSQTATCAPAIV